MVTHSPKQDFILWQKGAAQSLQESRESAWLTVAMSYTLAEMAHLGASTEQLLGARNFIHILQNLWEVGKEQKRLPVQSLKTYDAEDVAILVKREIEQAPRGAATNS